MMRSNPSETVKFGKLLSLHFTPMQHGDKKTTWKPRTFGFTWFFFNPRQADYCRTRH